MKKSFLLMIFFVFSLVSLSSAQMLLGARASGMGGTGVATAYDLTAAYYNPACLMASSNYGMQGSIASASNGIDKIISSASTIGDPAKYITDNYTTNLDVNGSIWGLVGANVNKVGITLLPMLSLGIVKPANSLGAAGNVTGLVSSVLTLGRSFSVLAGLPELHVGANLKYISGMAGNINVNVLGTGREQYSTSSGVGADIGALMSFNIPAVTELSVGVVVRDLGESITTSTKQKILKAAPGGQGFVEGAEQDLGSATATVNSTYAIGVAGKVPVVGILVAADLENGNNFSNTHFGVEYPVIAGLLALRAGMVSGNNLSQTTIGAKVAIPVFTINAAMINDNKISQNSSYVVDFGAAL